MKFLSDLLSQSAVWGVLLTLAAFALGTLLNRRAGKAILNPLLLGSIFVIVFLSVLHIPYADYKASAAPVNYLLLPATVSLAIPLYEKLDLLRKNAAAILAGITMGTLLSLGSVFVLALVLKLEHIQYVTLLPKSVTTAISMDVSAELGGIAALTGAIVILTGIAGNLLAESVCKWFRISIIHSPLVGTWICVRFLRAAKARTSSLDSRAWVTLSRWVATMAAFGTFLQTASTSASPIINRPIGVVASQQLRTITSGRKVSITCSTPSKYTVSPARYSVFPSLCNT